MIGGTNQEPLVVRVSGPIVTATGMTVPQMYEVVRVGDLGLVGEVVRLIGDQRDHPGLRGHHHAQARARPFGAPGAPLSVWLGPGLIGNIYDGIQRPLPGVQARERRLDPPRREGGPPRHRDRRWPFEPRVQPGTA